MKKMGLAEGSRWRRSGCRILVGWLMCSLGAGRASAQSYLLSLSGTFDGSDTVSVDGSTAQWQHNNFAYPTGVTLNGQSWQPQQSATLAFAAPLVPISLSNYTIRVNRLQGRDTMTAEAQGNTLMLNVDDTPNGADAYKYNVALIPDAPAPASTVASLTITGTIDGSDEVLITSDAATWVHKFWGQPSAVTINGIGWNPASNPVLPNSGATRFLPAGVNLENVTIQKNAGRDVAALDTRENQLAVQFADNPLGAGAYSVTLSFPGSPYAAPRPADANSDGKVDFADLLAIQPAFGSRNATWDKGDFNIDGIVDANDLDMLAAGYQGGLLTAGQMAQLDPAFAAEVERAFAVVPEPSATVLLCMAVAATLGFPRRRRSPRPLRS